MKPLWFMLKQQTNVELHVSELICFLKLLMWRRCPVRLKVLFSFSVTGSLLTSCNLNDGFVWKRYEMKWDSTETRTCQLCGLLATPTQWCHSTCFHPVSNDAFCSDCCGNDNHQFKIKMLLEFTPFLQLFIGHRVKCVTSTCKTKLTSCDIYPDIVIF